MERIVRTAAINLRAEPSQRDLIDYAASLLGKTRSDFMLDAACIYAQNVILDRTVFQLNDEKFNPEEPVYQNIDMMQFIETKMLIRGFVNSIFESENTK